MNQKENAQSAPAEMRGLFSWPNTDYVLETARAFERLLDFECCIAVEKDRKQSNSLISFSAADFHHLAGLHKLEDNYTLRRDRQTAHGLVLSGAITDQALRKSSFFEEADLESRWRVLRNLEALLDSHETIFRFINKLAGGTRIRADWLLEHQIDKKPVYVFLGKCEDDIPDVLSCRTLFPKTRDFAAGQPRFTLLRKEKRRVSTNETFMLYDELSNYDMPR